MSLISIFIASVLTENIILTKFLGICPFIGTSNKEKGALGMGLSVIIVVLLSGIIVYLLYNFVLVPTNTEYLRTVLFILVIASMVQLLDIIMAKKFPNTHQLLGIYLPLIASNCAVLGITFLVIDYGYNFVQMLVFVLGSGLGFAFLIYLYATIRESLATRPIPVCFKGVPIALVIAGIMAMIVSRYGL